MKHFIVLSPANIGSISNYMLNDLKSIQEVEFFYIKKIKKSYNRWISLCQEVVSIIKWNLYGQQQFIKYIKKYKEQKNVLILTNEVVSRVSINLLKKIKDLNVYTILILIDPIRQNYFSISKTKEAMKKFSFNKIITFDPDDSKREGYEYCNTLYSKYNLTNTELCFDFYYSGNIKDRLHIFESLSSKVKKYNIKADVNLLGCNKKQRSLLPRNWILKKYQPYEIMLEKMNISKCIFDITQNGQSGVTLRYYEAIVYNKKLLTNNDKIVNLPFYNERYMKIYHNIDEIDWEWVMSDDMPDYNYNGQFSPINLIEKIKCENM